MKKLVILITAFVVSFQTFAYDPINEKLIQSFKSTFPNAAQVSWQELHSEFIVSFVEQNIRARAYYDKEGALMQVIRYYHEQTLPFNILHTILFAQLPIVLFCNIPPGVRQSLLFSCLFLQIYSKNKPAWECPGRAVKPNCSHVANQALRSL